MASYSNKKQLKFVITLGTGDFDSKGDNQITLQGFRASADISLAGGYQMGELRAKIYGVKLSDMNAITTFTNKVDAINKTTIIVYAIDGLVESVVYGGNILNAFANFQGMPDVYLDIQAGSSLLAVLQTVPPRSYRGDVDVASVLTEIALTMGKTIENTDVNVKLSNIYLCDTAMRQFQDLAQMADVDYVEEERVIAIMRRGTPRNSVVPLISAATGLIGYPVPNGISVNARCLYNPAIRALGMVKIETEVKRAEGYWKVNSMSHQLESEKPNGAWFTSFQCVTVDGYVAPTR